jgi:hypothetical protein
VVVERGELGEDGLRLATGPGIPSVGGAIPLGRMLGG